MTDVEFLDSLEAKATRAIRDSWVSPFVRTTLEEEHRLDRIVGLSDHANSREYPPGELMREINGIRNLLVVRATSKLTR